MSAIWSAIKPAGTTSALLGEEEVREPVEKAWDDVTSIITDEIVDIRRADRVQSVVPDSLVALSMNEALQGTLTRMLWDKRFSLEDPIRTHVWLWLAVRKALRDPDDIVAELSAHEDRIRQTAAAPPPGASKYPGRASPPGVS